jgi:FkbM family methyltransferase
MLWRRNRPAPQNTAPLPQSFVTTATVSPWVVTALERPVVPSGLHGFVDSPPVGLVLPGWMTVEGWTFATDGTPVVVTVEVDAVTIGTVAGGLPRGDVAEAYSAQGIDQTVSMHSGFGGDLALDALNPTDGPCVVQVKASGRTNGAVWEAVLAIIHVRPATNPGSGAQPHEVADEETSQAGEVDVLRRLLPASAPHLVVDIGAHDGRFLSNSYPFIASGWSGILIEPLPSVFERLVANHRRHPHAVCVNVACGATRGFAPLFIGTDGDLGQNSTLSTDDTDWMRDHRTDRSIEVRVEPISSVLDEQGISGDIGLLLVDCEGMDLEALQGLDPTRHRPWIVVTEQYAQNPSKESAKAELLRSWGMTFRSSVGYNDIWIDERVVPV